MSKYQYRRCIVVSYVSPYYFHGNVYPHANIDNGKSCFYDLKIMERQGKSLLSLLIQVVERVNFTSSRQTRGLWVGRGAIPYWAPLSDRKCLRSDRKCLHTNPPVSFRSSGSDPPPLSRSSLGFGCLGLFFVFACFLLLFFSSTFWRFPHFCFV